MQRLRSSRRKLETALRLLHGENLNTLSREFGVSASRLSQWRKQVLSASHTALKSRRPDETDEEAIRLRAKVVKLMMDNELLREKTHRLMPTTEEVEKTSRAVSP